MADGTNLGTAYGEVKIGTEGAETALYSLSQSMANVGNGLKGAITDPIMGIGSAAMEAGTKLNEGLANIQSLGLTQDRVLELKGSIQELGIETGKGTSDMADGLYMVESAFGDSADTASILEINAKSAAAGLASTTDAINLTSAVTKGFGDTTKEAVQHTSDLALKTVELGQTTFPQLASAIGVAVPMATQLSVSQEELFAVMATGSGVTGTTGQVATQLRGILQSLMVPTDSMTTLFAKMGVTSGEALIKQKGLQGAIQAVVGAAKASGEPLQSYMGSVEGQTLALTLAGPQAEKYASNLKGMGDAAGKTDEAFKAQTEGLNSSGFAMQQMRAKMEVFYQKIYDGLGPALTLAGQLMTPIIDFLGQLADWFGNASGATQLFVLAIAGIAAAAGPVIVAFSTIYPFLPLIGEAFATLLGPVTLVIGAVALLYAAWVNDFGGIQEITANVFGRISALVSSIIPAFQELVAQLTGIGLDAHDSTEGIEAFIRALGYSEETASNVAQNIVDLGGQIYGFVGAVKDAGVASNEAADSFGGILESLGVSKSTADSAASSYLAFTTKIVDAKNAVQQFGAGALGELGAQLLGLNENTYDSVDNIQDLVFAFTGSEQAATQAGDLIWAAGDKIREIAAQVQAVWAVVWPQVTAILQAALASILLGLSNLGTVLGAGFTVALNVLQATWTRVWNALPAAVGVARAVVEPVINAFRIILGTQLPAGLNVLAGAWARVWGGLGATTSGAASAVGGAVVRIASSINTSLPGAMTSLLAKWTAFWNGLPANVSSISSTIAGSIVRLAGTIQLTWGTIWTTIPLAVSNARETISSAWRQIEIIFGPSVSRIVAAFQPMMTGLMALGPQFRAVGEAALPVLTQIRNLAALVGAVLGVVLLAAMNALGATMAKLPEIVGGALDQVKNTLNFLSTTVRDVIGVVKALLSGDWAAAWTAAKAVATDFTTFVTNSLANARNMIMLIMSIIGTTITNTLKDLGFTQAAAAVQSVIDKISALSTTISGLVTGELTIGFTEPAWVTNLTAAAASYLVTPEWVTNLVAAAASLITIPEWVTTIATNVATLFTVPGWVTAIKATVDLLFTIPGWVTTIGDTVATLFTVPSWVTTIGNTVTKLFGTPTWVTSIGTAISNLVATPGWIATFQTAINSLTSWVPKLPSWMGGGEAVGSSYMPGGEMRGINERGRELISIPSDRAILPPGSKVYTNGQSNRMLGGAGGGGDLHIHIDGVTVNSEMDLNVLAFKLGQKTKWELGRG